LQCRRCDNLINKEILFQAELTKKFTEETIPRSMGILTKTLEANGGEYFVGKSVIQMAVLVTIGFLHVTYCKNKSNSYP
jgi:hypothetical protein